MVLFLLEKKSGTHFLGPEKISQSLNITSTPTGDFFPHFDHWAKYRQGWSWRLVEITKNHIVNKFLRYHSNTYVTKQMCKYTNIWDIVCIFIYTHILPSTMDHMVKRSFLYRKPPSPNKKKKTSMESAQHGKLPPSPSSPRAAAAALLGAATPPWRCSNVSGMIWCPGSINSLLLTLPPPKFDSSPLEKWWERKTSFRFPFGKVYFQGRAVKVREGILGMVIPPIIGNPDNGYLNPYCKVDDHP